MCYSRFYLRSFLVIVSLWGFGSASVAAAAPAASPMKEVVEWGAWPENQLKRQGAATKVNRSRWLELRAEKPGLAPEISLRPAEKIWDLAAYGEVAVPVINRGTRQVRVWLRVADTKSVTRSREDPRTGRSHEAVVLPDGRPVWLFVLLGGPEAAPYANKMISLRQLPADFVRRGEVKGDSVAAISLGAIGLGADESVEFGAVVARGTPAPRRDLPEAEAFPLFDDYGQYRHHDWPDKIRVESDFAVRREREESDLRSNPRPTNWDGYGGWSDGPRLKATGYFRVEKVDGKWWWVDPEGQLFWSHGVVRVGTRIRVGGVYRGTPLPDREYLFRLPPKDTPLGAFYGTEPQATRFYYVGRHNHAVYDFLEANLFRKYGSDWAEKYAEQAQRRLASWGLNTVANSSDPAVYLLRRTPYTAVLYSAPLGGDDHRIAGSGGNWGKLPDPFDPGWRALMDRTLRTELKDVLNDPWCLGFFVDNELNWGAVHYLAEATLSSPEGQPAKRVFLDNLQRKYGGIEALNASWKTQHASWADLSRSTAIPNRTLAGADRDLRDFSREVIEAYFRGCRDAVKAAAPNHLYLGVRFARSNEFSMQSAARYCDVISINPYAATVDDLTLPEGIDRPILVGEFHFGALDRGPFASALVLVADQAARARAYVGYVTSALRNPRVIGTHWFQYFDQPTSGRFDSENYQTGLVDLCDTPYWETIEACREMSRKMYPLRHTAGPEGRGK